MTTPESLKDEIAYLRTLAEEGQKPVGSGGLILVTAGLGWAGATVAQAGIFAGSLPPGAYWIWYLPMPAFVAALIWTTRAQKRRPGAASPLSRAMSNAWTTIGCAMGAVVVSFIVLAAATGGSAGWVAMPSVMISLYGAGWMLYAILSKQRWVMAVAIACFVAAPLNASLATRPVQSMLGYGAALVLLVALPGAIMMIRDRRWV